MHLVYTGNIVDVMKWCQPSKLETQVLSVLWAGGPATVRAVLEAMPDGKARAYTTILSVLQVMEKKGLVSHTAQGNTHVYGARVTRVQVTRPLLRGLVRDVFGGSTATALQHLLAESEVSRDEMIEIKRLLVGHDGQGEGRPAAGEADSGALPEARQATDAARGGHHTLGRHTSEFPDSNDTARERQGS